TARAGLTLRPCATAASGPLPDATAAPVAGLGFEPIRDPRLARRLARVSMEREQVGSVADLFLRRTAAGQFGAPAREVLSSAAAELAGGLGWTEEREQSEILEFLQLYRRMGVISPETEDVT
ncbi:MAG: hypothetical protein P8049_11925, partial [Gemmatimonadota bacterium]